MRRHANGDEHARHGAVARRNVPRRRRPLSPPSWLPSPCCFTSLRFAVAQAFEGGGIGPTRVASRLSDLPPPRPAEARCFTSLRFAVAQALERRKRRAD